MDVQIIQKNLQQQNQVNIFFADIMSTIWTFDNIENKHSLYCGEDRMKKFCISLREHATNVIKFKKKKMLPLTKKS